MNLLTAKGDLEQLIGLPLDQAQKFCEEQGFIVSIQKTGSASSKEVDIRPQGRVLQVCFQESSKIKLLYTNFLI
ncbi:hypothetical protein F9B85_01370 [Heliorestis acidaminivorans]|uniref:PASTA domain-containing protein n=1 Tax=Heliorestis acidaminivorans TaxID=553427 RepID=A0A6I0F6B2_9FIRM|nr:hypothetical protein [Heliorestis acidaminivorans]KAB2954367.1 hypothetical protein F9B85_01370 [Heliorestis acidaminivorans]